MKREEDERRQKGRGGQLTFSSTFQHVCLGFYMGLFFSPKKSIFFWKNAREDFKIRDTKRTHTLTYQKTIILSRYQQHQRKLTTTTFIKKRRWRRFLPIIAKRRRLRRRRARTRRFFSSRFFFARRFLPYRSRQTQLVLDGNFSKTFRSRAKTF